MASATNDRLIIFRGDDTGGTFGRRLAFTIEAESGVSLDGCRAEWVFDGITKEIPAPLVPGEVREIFYSHNETCRMALGVRYGTFRIIDSAGKSRTLTNTKAVEVTDSVSRCYPGAGSATFTVRGIGDVRHSDFADLETKDGMTLKEVGTMVNTLIRKLKGTVAALASVISFSAFADVLGPQTEFGDVPPSATLSEVVTAAGAGGGGVDTNAVREIANEVVAPVEAAVADRYTKSEADGRFVPMNFPEPYSGGFEWVSDGLALKSGSVFTIPSANSLVIGVGGYSLGEFLSGGYWNISDNKFIRNDSFSLLSDKVEQKADKATTLSGYGITDGATTNDLESGLLEKRGVDDNICHKTEVYWVGKYLGQKYTFRYGMSNFGVECWNAGEVALFKRIGTDLTKDNLCPEDWTGTAYVGVAWYSSGNVAERRVEAVEGEPYITRSIISVENPAFSNAVLAVGIDTNAVAQIGELKEFFDGLPVGTVGTSLGGIILALLAAVSWLKKNALTDGLETDGTPTDVKLDKFFTESNSLLNARITYERNSTGLKDRAFNALTFDGTEFNLSSTLASVTPTSDGQPRDLLIVATATAATTISFTAGTIKGDKPTIDGAGTWLITLTEYAANTWYCRQIKMEDAV